MRVVYIDSALSNELGPNANFCRNVVRELRARRVPVTIYGHISASKSLGGELGVRPLFRISPHGGDNDPDNCRWLTVFEKAVEWTQVDLNRIGVLRPSDLLYLNSATPPLLMAALKWLKKIPRDKRPRTIVELNLNPGIIVHSDGRVGVLDPRQEARPTLYNYVSRLLSGEDAAWLKLISFDATMAAGYCLLFRHMVDALPPAQQAITDCHSREGRKAITVSVLGHQRADKGYHLVPEIAQRLLEARPDVAFLAHNGAPSEMPKEQQALRTLASGGRKLVLNEVIAGPPLWSQLIDASDLILCPYDPAAFGSQVSAVANEAIANAVPVVVPECTSMAETVREFGNPGEAFAQQNTESILAALSKVLDNYDQYARAAHAASKRWAATRGPSFFVDSLLQWQPGLAKIPARNKDRSLPEVLEQVSA